MQKRSLIFLFAIISFNAFSQSFITPFEKSNGKQTATYFECIDFYKALDQSFASVKMITGDTADAGYPLHVVLFSADKNFNYDAWHKQQKPVILINNGIHPGEPDGIDASMILLRDLATGKI